MKETKRMVFATNNPDKLREIREIVGNNYEILSLRQIGCNEELPETAATMAGNAEMKARYVSEKYGVDCFADDTGLEVEALGGAPGVHTARYATEGHDPKANMSLLLANLKGISNRSARFVTAIALVKDGDVEIIEGVCKGSIAEAPAGTAGFGYDPVFIPDEGKGLTFAEMGSEEKNMISHRGKATRRLIEILNNKL